MSDLDRAIYKTIAFFDAQDLALTALEIKNYLDTKAQLAEIEKCIAGELSGKIEHQDGLYFLFGRSELISLRKERYRISLSRFRKAKKFLRGLRFFPFLRAVAISGSQALLNSTDDSDIDLFIIAKKNRIWLTRALVSVYFQFLGQRRHGEKIANRFCLNHYVAEGQVISQDKNLYTAVEYASLLPVLGVKELQDFWARNSWIKEFLADPRYEITNSFFDYEFSASRKICEFILDYTIGPVLNYLLGLYQKHRIKMQKYILVSDNELSFHPGSRGQRVLAAYKNRVTDAAND